MSVIRPAHVLLYALGVIVVLGGGTFLLYRQILPQPAKSELPSAGDALLRVPVWLGDGDSLRVVIRPYYQWPEADRAHDAVLSAYLFPQGSGARFAVVWVFNYGTADDVVFDRDASPLALRAVGDRSIVPLDLPDAVARATLRPDVLLGLKTLHAHERRVTVPPSSYRRILVALPADCPVLALTEARVLGLALRRREVVRYRLEDYLADPVDRIALLPGGS